jgi:hypothetical protein
MAKDEAKREREVVSKEEFDRRVKAAAWDEMDRMPHPLHHWTMGSMFRWRRRNREQQQDPLKMGELEAKLRRREEEREQRLYGPKQSRWWHALWPFGR